MSDKASVHPIDRLMVNIGVAFFFAIVLARAHLQSITIDEATTYDMWIRPLAPDYWYAASNNHILNSILIRLTTTLFGLSHLTIRSGAIVGAMLYLLAIRWFCLHAVESRVLKCVALVCLAANPFLLDYLVAARGYGLAMDF